jgi:nucleotide-binding universal stress UspA family protein
MATVVVGVDGSETSMKALGYAVEEARRRGWGVRAVHSWHLPPNLLGEFVLGLEPLKFEQSARAVLDRALDELGGTEGVTVEPVLLEGQPAEQLLKATGPDDVLVIGSRGLGGFSGLLLGSVGQALARHAKCPLVIVPHDEG